MVSQNVITFPAEGLERFIQEDEKPLWSLEAATFLLAVCEFLILGLNFSRQVINL